MGGEAYLHLSTSFKCSLPIFHLSKVSLAKGTIISGGGSIIDRPGLMVDSACY